MAFPAIFWAVLLLDLQPLDVRKRCPASWSAVDWQLLEIPVQGCRSVAVELVLLERCEMDGLFGGEKPRVPE